MTEMELIKQIAQPIIDQILLLEEKMGSEFLTQCPEIRLLRDEFPNDLADRVDTYDDQLLKKIEAYIQNELESWFKPTILH